MMMMMYPPAQYERSQSQPESACLLSGTQYREDKSKRGDADADHPMTRHPEFVRHKNA